METSRILVALEELERWHSRRDRLQGELQVLRERRRELREELERVKEEVAGLREVLFQPGETESAARGEPPFPLR